MGPSGQRIAIYGRLLDHSRERVVGIIQDRNGIVERDLTRRTGLLVVGRGSLSLIPSGSLARQLARAETQQTPVIGEGRLNDFLADAEAPDPTFPLDRIKPQVQSDLAQLLNAFDLVNVDFGFCRFGDVEILRNAMSLLDDGHEMSSVIRILFQARSAPPGRFEIVTNQGEARLNWGDAITGLDGQGMLPLPEQPDLDDLFEAASLAEAEGRLDDAARAYANCAQMDRRDPIASFNLANVLVKQGALSAAMTRLDQAIARDKGFAEAYFNRARLQEEQGALSAAENDLRLALESDPDYPQALFNLAQLEIQNEKAENAIELLDRFLKLSPGSDWHNIATKARSVAAAMIARSIPTNSQK